MTWRLSALTSGGAAIVAALAAYMAPIERSREAPPTVLPQAVDRSGSVVDLGAQADRLKTKLAEVNAYQHPARDAFRFGLPPRRVVESPEPVASVDPPAVVAPARPPYGLVSLVKEGDELDTGYRVMSITDDAVTLESTNDGTQTVLHLSNSDSR
jgi:hypothetical protein